MHLCPPDHLHGIKATCYGNHGCRCSDCREGHRLRMDRRRRLIAYGRWGGMADATEARAHVNKLRETFSVREIAAAAGVTSHVVNRVSLGWGDRIRAEHVHALLHCDPAPLEMAGTFVDGTGTARRVQALMFMGWTGEELMRRTGLSEASIYRPAAGGHVTVRVRDTIAVLYDELWDQEPSQATPSEAFTVRRAKLRARRLGYVSPLAWDDIDDPEEKPQRGQRYGLRERNDGVVIQSALDGEKPQLSPLETREVVATLHRDRWSDLRIAEWVGVSDRTVARIRDELNLPAWIENGGRKAA